MKKLISSLVGLSMVFSLAIVPCFADNSGAESGEKAISVIIAELKERGFTEEFLSGFFDEELRAMHQDSEGYVVHIAEDENDGIELLSNDIPEEDLDFSLSVAYYAKQGSANVIDHIVIHCRYEWLANEAGTMINPIVRGIDGITINWDHNAFSPDDTENDNANFIFRQYKRMSTSSSWVAYDPITALGTVDAGGLGFTFNLEDNASYYNRGVASFELYPTDGGTTLYYSGTGNVSRMSITANYGHCRTVAFPVQISPNNHFGFSIDASRVDSTRGATEPVKYYKNP